MITILADVPNVTDSSNNTYLIIVINGIIAIVTGVILSWYHSRQKDNDRKTENIEKRIDKIDLHLENTDAEIDRVKEKVNTLNVDILKEINLVGLKIEAIKRNNA